MYYWLVVGGPQLKNEFSAKHHRGMKFSGVDLMGRNYHPGKNQLSTLMSWSSLRVRKVSFYFYAGFAMVALQTLD